MVKKVKFENGVREVQIINSSGFNYLNLTSATINKGKYGEEIPSVEMILLNDRTMLTSYSNLIPGTNKLNCFDLLQTAANIPALVNEKFHTLKCVLPAYIIDDSIEIELAFEIE
jgi:hypothetical protein